jgi:2-polyprenyl-3-methyl-5-hydroxy-6-metoxy-1,4-benzoquinol methylase
MTHSAEAKQKLDRAKVEQFAATVLGHYVGGAITYMIDLGHRTGLFDAAAQGPATSVELADRAGLQERYVREWASALAAGGVLTYDATDGRFTLPLEHAACLTDLGPNMAPVSLFQAHMGKTLGDVATAFRDGGGVPYSKFRPEFTDVMDGLSRRTFDGHLVDEIVPLAPGLPEQLTTGARVADVGCGTGHSTNVLAQAFPRSTFAGFDYAEEVVERARKEAAELGLRNVTFELADISRLRVEQAFDVAVSFDTIHDQANPAGAIASVYAALRPGGTYLFLEPYASSNLEDNIGNPMAPMVYAISTLHCMTVSLAEGGAGLGTACGEQKFRELLEGAGFVDLAVTAPAPGDPMGAIFVTRKPG